MLPESKYIEEEIIIRKMVPAEDVKLTTKAKTRWLALSLGLISPNETRRHLLDILEVLLKAKGSDQPLGIEEIKLHLNQEGKQVSEKTIYYHINRLKAQGFVSKVGKKYLLGKPGMPFHAFLKEKLLRDAGTVAERVKEVLGYL